MSARRKKSLHYGNHSAIIIEKETNENKDMNELKLKSSNYASIGNIILLMNLFLIFSSLTDLIIVLFNTLKYVSKCKEYNQICCINIICYLIYLLGSSFAIIAIKKKSENDFNKYMNCLYCIMLLYFIKVITYQIYYWIDSSHCIFDYVEYKSIYINFVLLILVFCCIICGISKLKNLASDILILTRKISEKIELDFQ